MNEELIKKTDIQKLADDGIKIYQKIKHEYEPQNNEKFLAIDIGTEKVYLGDTTSEAVEKAKIAHPEKVFYVVKIGSSFSEVLAELAR